MTTDDLREAYLSFFESKGCVRKPSDVLVPNDKTVLFTPAGMNQFKREFMGLGDPSFRRATTCQKCLRTGDIENVGVTAFHETFFEMLGNFSFGDYFKREAIHWAWEFLTRTLKIDPGRLTVTVYLDDDEAFNIWHDEIKLPAGRIARMGEDDNFWPAGAPTHGPDGVCGPCSEIFFHGNGPKEVEIWNLVFTQFNRVGPNQLEPLPSKNIDTGMGLERAAACLQGVPTVFETDVFRPIVSNVAQALGFDLTPLRDEKDRIRIRRMSDHLRALTFCIHENVRPDKQKQGYVIRRLLRRAVLDAYLMGQNEPFLFDLVPVVADVMSRPYPELKESVPRIQTVVREEEAEFLSKLEGAIRRLSDVYRKTRAAGSSVIDGQDVYDLYQTHGIPKEITESLATEHNLTIDHEGYERARERHAATSRGTSEAFDVFATGPLDVLKKEYHHGSEFLGYGTTSAEGTVVGIVEQGRLAESTSAGAGGPPIALVLDRTPFYGEAGGQVGDTGVIKGDGFVFRVEDTKKDNDFTLHLGRVAEGTVAVNAKVVAEVDAGRRQAIRRAHSATHVLHHALHIHLGKHAQQAGSKVEPDRLRFDFANPEAVGRERLRAIEETVNDLVLRGDPVSWSTMPMAEARALGAMALFGEKYPEVVRVVRMGDFSRELCGGNHLDNVGQVGLFKVLGEESVSAGTRRITALTGKAALEHVRAEEDALAEVAAALRVPAGQAAGRVAALFEEVKALKKQATQRRRESGTSPEDLLNDAPEIGGARVIVASFPSETPDELRQRIDVLRRKAEAGLAVLLASAADDKVNLAAGLTPDLVARGLHAGQWLKDVAPVVGGGGGGRPDMAQAGGKDPSKLPDALARALDHVRARLGAGG
ncbi:MAG TPA: alanine--tRNA ligase [Isosphaeraceae bacterium]|jgi:alanyl-tRNA synthetase|nr:alanine--tRNA ligase [Isosphaeraceae bacterium]